MPSAVDEAVAARIAAARARIARQQAERATRGRRRTYGLVARHADKLARDDVSTTHPTDPQETPHG